MKYRITHGDVKGVISYYPYVDQFEQYHGNGIIWLNLPLGNEREGWIHLDEEMKAASDELGSQIQLEMIWHFCPIHPAQQEILKGLFIRMAGHMRILKTAAPNWLCIEEGDTVWATAGPGWQKWIWSPFLSVLGSAQQD